MIRKATGRLVYGLLVAWGVITVVFIIFNVVPGDPAAMMLGQRADKGSLESIRREMGLDQPLSVRYIRYLNDLSPLSVYRLSKENERFTVPAGVKSVTLFSNRKISLVVKQPWLGRSFQSGRPVGGMLASALPNSLILAVLSILVAFIFGNILGISCALSRDSWFDRLSLFISTIGMALPSFFAAILTGWLFAFVLQPWTGLNLTGNLWEIDDLGRGMRLELKNLILPVFTLGLRPLSVVVQLTRSSMIEVMAQDYIRTARAKGLSAWRVIGIHAFRNALNPVVTAISGWFAGMLAGVVFIEYIFGWK